MHDLEYRAIANAENKYKSTDSVCLKDGSLTSLLWDIAKMNHFDQSCYGIEIGVDYPFPIVNLEESGKIAREKIWGHRKGQKVKKESQRILKTHVRKQ